MISSQAALSSSRVAPSVAPALGEREILRWAKHHALRSGIWFPILVLALRFAGAPGAYAAYSLLILYALRGPSQGIKALFLSWFLSHLSPGLVVTPPGMEILRILCLFAALTSAVLASFKSQNALLMGRTVSGFVLFGAFCLVHSALVSYAPDVSLLKAVSFLIMTLALSISWFSRRVDVERLQGWIFFWLAAIAFASAPLLLLPLGYLTNGNGFQGILSQPQVFGMTMALTGAWIGGRMLRLRAFSAIDIGLAALVILMLFLSESRGAMLAAFGGLVLSYLLARGLSLRIIRSAFKNLKHKRVFLLIVCSLFTGALFFDKVSSMIERTISKRSDNQTISSAFDASRGALISRSLQNFYANPVLGIGFGVASNPADLKVRREPVFGLPVAASVEKGNMYSAILEEVGFAGFLLFSGVLLVLLNSICRSGQLEMVWLYFAALLVNLGEAVLFSPNGIGLLVWIVLLMATSARSAKMSVAK